jgi:muramoyltetrapeptide carboxypeptidase
MPLVRRAAKLLIGYSDITALHALWAQQGLASLHAPMPASDLLQPGHEGDERGAL